MKGSKIAVVLSFLLGGAAGAVAYSCFGPVSEPTVKTSRTADFQSVSLTQTTRGELTQTSPVNFKDGSRYQIFSIQPDQTGALTVLQEGALNAHMILMNDHHEVLQTSYDGELIYYVADASADELILVVSGADAHSYGPFRLRTEWLDMVNDGPLPVNQQIQGYLNGAPNQYELVIEDEGMYQIGMSSSAFDSFLRIEGSGISESDDDSGLGLDAQLTLVLQPGEYQVTALTHYGNARDAFGTYTLEVNELNSMANYQQGGVIELGHQIRGFLQGGQMTYQLVLEEDTQVHITANSVVFDTVLEVQGHEVTLFDDDGGEGTNSMLYEYLPAGEYTILVRPFASGHGEFSLQVR